MGNKYISIVKDVNTGWWKKFSQILSNKNIRVKLVEIERNDWLHQIGNIKYVIWRPNLSKPYFQQAQEKLYILENCLGKKVYPNQKTFWHYNTKNSETYLGKINRIKMPESFISYSYEDSLNYIKKCEYPIVSKAASGAGSKNVRLLNDYSQAKRELDYLFNKGFINKAKGKILRKLGLRQIKYDFQKYYVSYQQFIPNNSRDYRITTIGDKYAFAFYRENRENDFRASGSGKIIYIDKVVEHDCDAIKYFLDISKKLGFDTMCYDILYKTTGFVTTEFSYTFNDIVVFNCQGYYELKDDKLEFVKRHTWPQELIIEYLLNKWRF